MNAKVEETGANLVLIEDGGLGVGFSWEKFGETDREIWWPDFLSSDDD